MTSRPNLFEEEGIDVSGFAPKTDPVSRADKDALRQAGEAAGFQSRPVQRPARRYRTGRTAQFNTRIMPAAFDRFYQIADEQGWKIGETVERALAALERELGQGR
jgi:hypothetical protein